MSTPSAVTTMMMTSAMNHIGWNPLAQTGRTIARTTTPSASRYRMLRELNQSPMYERYSRACSRRDPTTLVLAGLILYHTGQIENENRQGLAIPARERFRILRRGGDAPKVAPEQIHRRRAPLARQVPSIPPS